MVAELVSLIDRVWRYCESAGSRGRTVTLKIKFADFEIITRSRSVSSAVANGDDLAHLAIGLLENASSLPDDSDTEPQHGAATAFQHLNRTRLVVPPVPMRGEVSGGS
jgi:hypothetical protein